ncbi:zinc-dependent metalloprotease, partial [Acinetobacter baumannii]
MTHEVGHSLGLRHNFLGSTMFTMKDLTNDKLIEKHGLGASIMDYYPLNTMAILGKSKHFMSPTIGVYDYHAIRYGYSE